jgi:protease-4
MPARQHVMAEKTTITGSIGVYAAFPNIAHLADKHGVRLNVIKAGDIKDSGSMFHPMTAQERELWQGLVDNAYARFLEVVEEGRPNLKGKLREPIPEESKEIVDRDAEGMVILDAAGKEMKVPFRRYRADGGIFTAQQAENYGLIDSIGYLPDAIQKAKEVAKLGDDYKAVTYEKQPSLFGSLLGGQAPRGAAALDPQKLAAAAEPRLWFLAPQSELAGVLAAMGRP